MVRVGMGFLVLGMVAGCGNDLPSAPKAPSGTVVGEAEEVNAGPPPVAKPGEKKEAYEGLDAP